MWHHRSKQSTVSLPEGLDKSTACIAAIPGGRRAPCSLLRNTSVSLDWDGKRSPGLHLHIRQKSGCCAHMGWNSGLCLPQVTFWGFHEWIALAAAVQMSTLSPGWPCLDFLPKPCTPTGGPAYLVRRPAAWEEVAVVVAVQ